MEHQWKCPECGSERLYHLDTFEGANELVYKFECKECKKRFYVEENNINNF